MADSDVDVANQALARLGEQGISSFSDTTDAAEKVSALYEDTILDLLSSYDWQFARERDALTVDGGTTPENEWTRAFIMPALRTVRVGNPLKVWDTTAKNAPAFFDYQIIGNLLFTNATEIVIEYTGRKTASLWPGYFVKLAVEALAAQLALPITENESKEQWHTQKAFGNPSEGGEGGLWRKAVSADQRALPTRGLLDDNDPIAAARFGGSRMDGRW